MLDRFVIKISIEFNIARALFLLERKYPISAIQILVHLQFVQEAVVIHCTALIKAQRIGLNRENL